VNKKGERFTDETTALLFPESANSIYRQPNKTSYTLFDEKSNKASLMKDLVPGNNLS